MITSTLVTGFLLAAAPLPATGDLLAVRVGRAETISQGAIENAVILVERGKIVDIGEDLPIERGIPILDRPDWVVTPGLVNCYSRVGMDSRAGRGFEPQAHASGEIYPRQDLWEDLLEVGVTTLGLYPAGTGIPGQAVAIKPHGETAAEMILADSVYLKIYLQSDSSSKKALRDALGKVAEHEEKVEKAREKWEKAEEKKKKAKKKKGDDDEEEEKKEGPTEFVPPEPDAKVAPFIALRRKELTALMRIQKASDYDHLIDVIEDEEFNWVLRCPLRNDIDLYQVKEKIGERELIVVLDTRITLQPSSRRERNIPAELSRAGAKIVLLPRADSVAGHKVWLQHVAELVAAGLDRDAALASVTLEAAKVLGLGERLGSLDPGKDANLVFWNGDPFEATTQVQAVMLEGEFVSGEVDQ
jgi:hypothetical protein